MKYRLLAIGCLLSLAVFAQEYRYTCSFFNNSLMDTDYFFSSTNATGTAAVGAHQNRLLVSYGQFHTPGNSLLLKYQNGESGHWNAAIFRQQKRGMDHFKNADFLSCWIYTNDRISPGDLPAVQLMRFDSTLSVPVSIETLQPGAWQQVLIPAEKFRGFLHPNDPETIIAVVFARQQRGGGPPHVLYIDDIEFLPRAMAAHKPSTPAIIATKGYAMHNDIEWKPVTNASIHLVKIYRSEDGNHYQPVGIQQPFIHRYSDFTGETGKKYYYKIAFVTSNYLESALSGVATVSTHPMDDEALLTMVQEASFRYYWDGAEPNSGLALENIAGRQHMIASGASGFGMMALIVGTERGFISRQESVDRFEKITKFLSTAATYHGAYPHFIDGVTRKTVAFFGERDNGADLVETAFLLQGLLTARQYFSHNDLKEKLIRDRITNIWNRVEWNWFRRYPDSKFLYWHWSPDQHWVMNHRLIGWNETMITYLLAIASPTHTVPASMYYSGWANQDSTGQQYRAAWSQTKDGYMYSNGKTYYGVRLDVGVSDGGPLFFTHYSFMGFDPHQLTDRYTNYFNNNKNIATINYRYCIENPLHFKGYGDSAWGLTASDGPFHYSADEPVVWQDHGKIAPTGAISSFPYLPKQAMQALKNYYYRYGKFLWGEYGFRDAFDLSQNWCSEIYMGLNQAPMTVMIENYRTGLIWKLFMRNADINNALKKLGKETALPQ